MSSPSVNNRGLPSDHIIGHDNSSKYQPCYPCRNASSASASTSMEEDEEPNTTTPQQAANVGDLMAKAKKAAASLWLILHAQVSYHTACRCIPCFAHHYHLYRTLCLIFVQLFTTFRTVGNRKAHVLTVAAMIQSFF